MNLTKIEMFGHRHFDQLNEIICLGSQRVQFLPLSKKQLTDWPIFCITVTNSTINFHLNEQKKSNNRIPFTFFFRCYHHFLTVWKQKKNGFNYRSPSSLEMGSALFNDVCAETTKNFYPNWNKINSV